MGPSRPTVGPAVARSGPLRRLFQAVPQLAGRLLGVSLCMGVALGKSMGQRLGLGVLWACAWNGKVGALGRRPQMTG